MTKFVQKEDLYDLNSITQPIISPNDVEAVFIKTIMDNEKNTYYAELWHVDLLTMDLQQWTFAQEQIAMVQWSADGQYVSFHSTRNDKKALYILNKDGGEAQLITDNLDNLSSYCWSEDNKELYFTAKVKAGESFGITQSEKVDKNPHAYFVDGLRYKLDGIGLLDVTKKNQLGKIDLATKAIERITQDDNDYTISSRSHDGKMLAVTVSSQANDDDFTSKLVLIDSQTFEQTIVMAEDGQFGGAAFSYDDQWLAFEGSLNEPYKNAMHNQIYVYNMNEKYHMVLTQEMDLPVGDYAIGDVQQDAHAPSVVWTIDNDLYFQLSSMGDVRLYYATLNGAIYPASPEEQHVYGYDVTKDGLYALLTVSTTTTVGELYRLEIATGEMCQLTTFNREYEQATTMIKPEMINTISDGELVWGWFMKPAHYKEGQKYPLILAIHGGPHMMYANTFVHEMQVLAAQDYAVLYVNPRGSHSYSQQFVNGVRGDYGGGDFRDLMASVDAILDEHSWIDRDRLGVTGGSYGGFMTNWIIGHTSRFKAALTQRSISNWVSLHGVSDIGYYFTQWQMTVDLTDLEKLWLHSPLKYVDQMTTPLMIIHSENDDRCPIEQAEQLYVAMKRKNKEVSFIRFPQASHNLSRTGLPNLRQERLSVITDWFDKKL
ncbi:S9 family peptidase [Kurthia sibirica]|uniref:Peptidase n=2 Tax=Kurthia sibirica TaxID=202750 RepID=A0A2U3AJF5_9BACL|nr:S9 family peptidase [Kurthia sibirica]PWI24668.1 peptidase [Kurthia sibirica]